MTSLNIINARIPGYSELQQILINEQGRIEAISSEGKVVHSKANFDILDVAGDWISLGGVDLQINGGLGLAFPNLDREHFPVLEKICQFLWEEGIDGFLPTIVTTSVEKIQRSLATLDEFRNSENTAQVTGVHLEGPFLHPEKRGAHPEKHLLPLTLDNVKRVLGDYAEIVKIITLAPELDTSGEVIPYLRSLGITVSLGHSQAIADQAERAFEQGASMVTHGFNAMPSLHHREPGLLGAALVHPNVYCGMIADGQHICPTMLKLLFRAGNGTQGLFLVSDALAPIGLGDGVYPWDEREIEVKQGTARLPNGTLAGTTLPLLTGARNLVKWGICDVEDAIALATDSPRKAIGLPGMAIGSSANLLRWHFDSHTHELSWKRL